MDGKKIEELKDISPMRASMSPKKSLFKGKKWAAAANRRSPPRTGGASMYARRSPPREIKD